MPPLSTTTFTASRPSPSAIAARWSVRSVSTSGDRPFRSAVRISATMASVR
jgi:hypothetical protein